MPTPFLPPLLPPLHNFSPSFSLQLPLPGSFPPSFPSSFHLSPFLAHFFSLLIPLLPSRSQVPPLKFPYLSYFLLLSPIPFIPTSPPFCHVLHPDTHETSVQTHSFLLAFLFLIRQAVHSVFQVLILDSKQRPCAFPS